MLSRRLGELLFRSRGVVVVGSKTPQNKNIGKFGLCVEMKSVRWFSTLDDDGKRKNDPLGALREFESEFSEKKEEMKARNKNVDSGSISEADYEDVVDEYLFTSADIAEKTRPTDEFLRKVNPVLFYKRKVNQMWERKECYFCETDHVSDLHFTNIPLISFFVSEGGNILPRRVSHCCAKHQRKLARTIKHSRHVGLFPFRGNMSGRFPLESGEDDSSSSKSAQAN
jgi:small subunit ribosomal protein S18